MAFCNIKTTNKNITKAKSQYLILSLCFGRKVEVQIKKVLCLQSQTNLRVMPTIGSAHEERNKETLTTFFVIWRDGP
jgi:hypothetical protein